jgi:hypothetical protein
LIVFEAKRDFEMFSLFRHSQGGVVKQSLQFRNSKNFQRGKAMRNFNLKLTFCLLLIALLLGGCTGSPPSDKSMEENFRANEADFNRLVMMFREDKLSELTRETAFAAPADPRDHGVKTDLPPTRMAEYRRLLRRTGIQRIAAGEQAILLYAFEGDAGWIFSDYRLKSYAYAEETPSPIVASLYNKKDLPDVDYLINAYKKIADRWYLNLTANKDIGIW